MEREQATTPDGPELPDSLKLVIWAWHHIKSNWELLTRFPVIASVLIVGYICWALGKSVNEERVVIANDRATFLNEQLTAYKDRLNGASPDQAAKQLADFATMLRDYISQVDELKKRQEKQESNSDSISKRLDILSGGWISEESLTKLSRTISTTGATSITLATDGACSECQEISAKLISALSRATNVRVRTAMIIGPGKFAPTGIGARPSNSISQERAKELLGAFKQAGIDFDEFPSANVYDTELELQINKRILKK
jgi:hypothetical protein